MGSMYGALCVHGTMVVSKKSTHSITELQLAFFFFFFNGKPFLAERTVD